MCCTNMHARLGWFNANYVAFRILFDEVFANTGSGAPCTDACYEIVNILARLFPNLRPRGLIVYFRIRFVIKLIHEEKIIPLRNEVLGVLLQTGHTPRGRGKMYVRPEHATDDVTFLERRKLGHDDNALVSLRSADHGDSDAGVPASVLDDGHSRLEGSPSLGVLEHGLRDSILDGSAGVLHLELDEDAGIVCFRFGGEDSAHAD
mmetsp:Transcript_25502/g.61311  ORF Transcript_25502/g.61311 Transcript_25502/m.61311 type:complete len:205 (-) Transcript_25502:177-791(-)